MHSSGLKFKKFDLHIHTSASNCFLKEHATNEETANAIIEKAIEEGLSAIAITDHNTGAFIPYIQEAARGKKICVFPGVEITVGDAKNHIIALLDVDKTEQDINDLLSRAHINNTDRGKKEAYSNKSVSEIIELIASEPFNGIPILAHIDSSNGVFNSMRGEPRTGVIQNPFLFSVEATNYNTVSNLLDGTDPTYKVKLSIHQSSDNPYLDEHGKRVEAGPNAGMHAINGIGYRYTYFKVDDIITLDSIKQCIYDPEVRIKVPELFESSTCSTIDNIKINSGFLENVDISFHAGLNSILGAKGVGKSLLVEFIRFALGQEPTNKDILNDHKSKLNEMLGQYGQVELDVTDESGKKYRIKRTYTSGDYSEFECTDIESGELIHADVSQLFRILALSQNEIIKIAENKNEELIKFIDTFFDFNLYRNQINIIESELNSLDREFATSIRAHYEKQKLQKTINTAQIELRRIESQLGNPIFREISRLERIDIQFKEQIEYLHKKLRTLESVCQTLLQMTPPVIDKDFIEMPAFLRNKDIISKSDSRVYETIQNEIVQLKTEIESLKNEHAKWNPEYEKKKQELHDFIRTVGGNIQVLEGQRKSKTAEISRMNERLIIVEDKDSKLSEIAESRKAKLTQLTTVYTNYFTERKNKCDFFEAASNNKLQIGIIESTNSDIFRQKMMEIKTGSFWKDHEIEKLCAKISPLDFVYELLRYEMRKESDPQKAEAKVVELSEKASFTKDKMRGFLDFIIEQLHSRSIEYENILSLQYKAIPTDSPIIKYNIGTKDTPIFKHISKISTGQKCTAMLILALSDGKIPIVIDQPEDSLDIRGIWEDMCSKLRVSKNLRQFIFTTHNSSVAVASDTDKFTILQADDSHGEVMYSGALDSNAVRKEVVEYLEGGNKAYVLKMLKYNFDPNEKKFN